jgi:hypothetical protein
MNTVLSKTIRSPVLMTDKLITEDHLHEAASLAAMMTSEERVDFEHDAIQNFIDGSTFHPPLDGMAIAYGIVIGRLAVKVRDSHG